MPGGEFRTHFGAVRLRVLGTGNLKLKLIPLGTDNPPQDLVPIQMSQTTGRYPNQLANMIQQKAQLEIRTTEFSEVFLLKQVILYVKVVATGYPR